MKRIVFVILILLSSCKRQTKETIATKVNAKDKIDNQFLSSIDSINIYTKSVDTINISKYFQNTVFEMGAENFLNSNCEFDFGCDCCNSSLGFTKNGSFYQMDYCMGDTDFSFGNYELEGNLLTLFYSDKRILKEYNYEREFDSAAVEYLWKETLTNKSSIKYTLFLCSKSGKLIMKSKESEEIILFDSFDYGDFGKGLIQKGFIEKLYSLEKRMNSKTEILDKSELEGEVLLVIELDSLQINNMKQKYGEKDFYIIADDAVWYDGIIREKVDSLGFKMIEIKKDVVKINWQGRVIFEVSKDSTFGLINYFIFKNDSLVRIYPDELLY